MKIVAFLAALVLAWTGLTTTAYADDEPPPPTVTWPEITTFNPAVYKYEYSISGMSGLRRYFVQVADGSTRRIPADGTFQVPFGSAGDTTATVLSCLHDSFTCVPVATSPRVHLVTWLRMELPGDPYALRAGAGEVTLTVPWRVAERFPGQTVTWRLATTTETEPVAEGVVDAPGTTGSARVVVPADIPSGRYLAIVRTEVNDEVLGHLVSEEWKDVYVDHSGPVLSVELPYGATFYPSADRYLDTMKFVVHTDESVRASFQVTDAQGAVVWTDSGLTVGPSSRRMHEWHGLAGGGVGPRPEGSYLLTVIGTDGAGNVGTASARVRLDHATLRHRTTVVHVGAASSVVERYTRCGSLRTPSSHGWRGSLGLLTDRTCGRTASAASTLHRARLPRVEGLFGERRLRISMVGGASTSRPGSRISLAYLNRGGRFRPDSVFGPAVRRYDGLWVDGSSYVTGHGTSEVVTWSVGTGGGYGYDVREFIVTLRYRVLA